MPTALRSDFHDTSSLRVSTTSAERPRIRPIRLAEHCAEFDTGTRKCHKRRTTDRTTPNEKMKSDYATERCTTDFAPIRAWAKGNSGAINRITQEIQKITFTSVNRHMVGRWLNDTDPVEPRYSYGMALIEAYETLAKADNQQTTKAE